MQQTELRCIKCMLVSSLNLLWSIRRFSPKRLLQIEHLGLKLRVTDGAQIQNSLRKHSFSYLPHRYPVRCVAAADDAETLMIDSAKADIDEHNEYVSHDSGCFGSLAKKQQHAALAARDFVIMDDEDSFPEINIILENMACI